MFNIKGNLLKAIEQLLPNVFSTLNENISSSAEILSKSPENFNSDVFKLLEIIHTNAILPLAGAFLTILFSIELISLMGDKNTFNNIGSFDFARILIKLVVSLYFVQNSYKLVIGLYNISSNTINIIASNFSQHTQTGFKNISEIMLTLKDKGVFDLLGIIMKLYFVSFLVWLVGVYLFVLLFTRILELYLYATVSAIPISALASRETKDIGVNFIKNIIALGFQGILIILVIGMYVALTKDTMFTDIVGTGTLKLVGYTFVLFMLLKRTGSISKSIFNAR